MNDNVFDQAKADALARFTDTGPDRLNCNQAMVWFALGVLRGGEELVTTGRYFGGGVSGMGGTCGVITGTALSLGLRDMILGGDSGVVAATQAQLKDLIRGFEAEFGACTCRQLTGHDMSTPEGLAAFKVSEAHDRCPVYVSWMCDRLYPLLQEHA